MTIPYLTTSKMHTHTTRSLLVATILHGLEKAIMGYIMRKTIEFLYQKGRIEEADPLRGPRCPNTRAPRHRQTTTIVDTLFLVGAHEEDCNWLRQKFLYVSNNQTSKSQTIRTTTTLYCTLTTMGSQVSRLDYRLNSLWVFMCYCGILRSTY